MKDTMLTLSLYAQGTLSVSYEILLKGGLSMYNMF